MRCRGLPGVSVCECRGPGTFLQGGMGNSMFSHLKMVEALSPERFSRYLDWAHGRSSQAKGELAKARASWLRETLIVLDMDPNDIGALSAPYGRRLRNR